MMSVFTKNHHVTSEIVFFDYVREQFGLSLCFQTIKHELGFRKRVVSTVEHRRLHKISYFGKLSVFLTNSRFSSNRNELP